MPSPDRYATLFTVAGRTEWGMAVMFVLLDVTVEFTPTGDSLNVSLNVRVKPKTTVRYFTPN